MEELRVISQNKMEELRVGPTSKGKKNVFYMNFFFTMLGDALGGIYLLIQALKNLIAMVHDT